MDAGSALAARAPEGDAFGGRVGAHLSSADQRAASTARPTLATVDPRGSTGARVAGERAAGSVAIGADHARAEVEECRHVDLWGGGGGQNAAHEEDLVGVLVSETGDVALIEQRDVHRSRVGREPTGGLIRIPRRAQGIGTQVTDERALILRAHHRDIGEVEADGVMGGCAEHGARLVAGLAPPPAALTAGDARYAPRYAPYRRYPGCVGGRVADGT